AAACADLLNERPDDDSVRYLYASALANAGRANDAIEEFSRLVANNADNTAALFAVADLFGRTGRYLESAKCYDKLINLYPKNCIAHLQKAMMLVKVGDIPSSVEAFESAVLVDPKNPSLLLGLAFMQMLCGRPAEALAQLEKAERAGATDPDLFYCRGLICLQQSRFDLAVAAAEKILENHPDHGPAWHLKGRALEAAGHLREALVCFTKVVELDTDPNEEA
ncbi:MAG TPA: tetratricopeptide repeat protein, partial [Methanocorpusculum sp.]|nr:tetratricopeptide repeat protein [Methanocorpusculum sp.]